MTRAPRSLLAAFGLLLLLCGQVAPATAQEATSSPEQELADRYVPVAYLREQERACATPPGGGEPYLPLPVEIVLDNDRVLIRDSSTDEVLGTGPNAAELATFGPDTYMDFPGDPRRPGCTYETDERARIAELGLEPTTYVHIVFDDDGERLALQYWFYWYFNHWNNTHESDWEMIQLMWDDIGGVQAALDRPPDRVGYSQHGNGEMAEWGDSKIELEDGTHPRVYPAAGSHATFFSNDTFLAWGERNSGFGCDVSSPPSVRTSLNAVVVPDDPDPQGDLAWLLYEGRWGERQPSAFNGPVGAPLNARWIDPWQASDNWRPFSIVVPGSKAVGPTMTEAFCSATGAGSRLLINAVVYPWITLPIVAAVIGAFVYFSRRSFPYFRRAFRLYRDNLRLFVGIGLIALPIGIVFNTVQAFLIERQPLEFVVQWLNDTAGARLTAVTAVGGVQQLAMLLLIAPAVVQAVTDLHRGRAPDIVNSYARSWSRVPAIAGGFLIMLVLAGLPLLFVIGLPITIWLVVRWHFFLQVLVFDRDTRSPEALRRSARLVEGRWWRTLFAVLIFDLLATIPGIVVGFGLLTLGGTAVGFANSVSSILYALAIPISVIAITLLYLDRVESHAASTFPAGSAPKPQQTEPWNVESEGIPRTT
jgi:hypothetical protein